MASINSSDSSSLFAESFPDASDMKETTVASELIHQGRVVGFYNETAQLPDGRKVPRDKLKHPGGVVICPVLPDGKLILVQQWRYPLGHALVEFPAGKLDTGEDPAACAARELVEETGYASDCIEALGSIYTAPGFCDERLWLYKATQLRAPRPEECLTEDDEENIRLITATPEQVWAWAKADRIQDAKTLSVLALACR